MNKFKLLLLDANIVIYLFELGIWDKVVDGCQLYLSRTVANIETRFFESDDGEKHDIDIGPYIQNGSVNVFDISVSEAKDFKNRFDPVYFEKLDPGETESLIYLLTQPEDFRICSADKIVYRVLGNLGISDQGISLEEVLQEAGLKRKLPDQFSKKYRERWTRNGFEEGLRGIGVK